MKGKKEGPETCNIGINVHVRVCGWWGNLCHWVSLSRRSVLLQEERERSNEQCVTHTHGLCQPTYRWASEYPCSKINAPITNSTGSSDWSWRILCSPDPCNVWHRRPVTFISCVKYSVCTTLRQFFCWYKWTCTFVWVCFKQQSKKRANTQKRKNKVKIINLLENQVHVLFKLFCLGFN